MMREFATTDFNRFREIVLVEVGEVPCPPLPRRFRINFFVRRSAVLRWPRRFIAFVALLDVLEIRALTSSLDATAG